MQKQKRCSSQPGIKLWKRHTPQFVSCCRSSVTPSVLSLCFRGPALCRWMPAAVFYHKSAPHQTSIKSPMGKGKKARQCELIKTFPHNHALLFCGRPYICCNKRHGGLSARNRWETQWPFRAQTLGRRSGRGGESIGRTGFTELTESQGDCEGRAGTLCECVCERRKKSDSTERLST